VRIRFLVLLLPLCVAACGIRLSAHRIEIQQGNYITQDMINQLKPGMTKDQVRFALGTALVVDVFHPERWEYLYTRQRADSSEVEHRRISVFFEDNKLQRVEGDVVPAAPVAGAAAESTTQ
jgi:outer membrane protein assembly factor BamE